MGKERGFTLVELLAAVLIIALLTAIAVPAFKNFVERTKMSEALMIVKMASDAVERKLLNEGDTFSDVSWDSLDLDEPQSRHYAYLMAKDDERNAVVVTARTHPYSEGRRYEILCSTNISSGARGYLCRAGDKKSFNMACVQLEDTCKVDGDIMECLFNLGN
jgi:prepilin-type N-terminal cleavage/methylation domain-containing protein